MRRNRKYTFQIIVQQLTILQAHAISKFISINGEHI